MDDSSLDERDGVDDSVKEDEDEDDSASGPHEERTNPIIIDNTYTFAFILSKASLCCFDFSKTERANSIFVFHRD